MAKIESLHSGKPNDDEWVEVIASKDQSVVEEISAQTEGSIVHVLGLKAWVVLLFMTWGILTENISFKYGDFYS